MLGGATELSLVVELKVTRSSTSLSCESYPARLYTSLSISLKIGCCFSVEKVGFYTSKVGLISSDPASQYLCLIMFCCAYSVQTLPPTINEEDLNYNIERKNY